MAGVQYQSIYASLPEDDEFITLSPLAKALWYTLKVKLPATGLGTMNPRVVATLVNCSLEQLAVAEGELSPKWVRRDGNLWWIVAGLRFQPSLSPDDRKHRAFVQKQASAMPDSPIVLDFRAAHTEWFGPSEPLARPIEGPSEHHGSKIDSSSKQLADRTPPAIQSPPVDPVRVVLLDRLSEPRCKAAVTVFLDRVPPTDAPSFWSCEVNGWLDGLNTPAGKEASEAHVTAALEEFNRKVSPSYDPPYIRGFLKRTMLGQAPRAPPRSRSSTNAGAQQVANILGGLPRD